MGDTNDRTLVQTTWRICLFLAVCSSVAALLSATVECSANNQILNVSNAQCEEY